MKILVINGPNINMLGSREPAVYGGQTYMALCQFIIDSANELGVDVRLYQSNHEGDIVDEIQKAYDVYAGIVINPAAYSHSSIAIMDAIKAVSIPTVEVHLTDITKRENFRHTSFVSLACEQRYLGYNFEGYRMAMQYLCSKYYK